MAVSQVTDAQESDSSLLCCCTFLFLGFCSNQFFHWGTMISSPYASLPAMAFLTFVEEEKPCVVNE